MGFVEAMAIEVSRGDDARPADPAGAVPALHLRRGHRALRLGQAGPALRDGARRPRAGAGRRAARRLAASASSTTRWPAAAGSRPSSRPGWAARPAREIDELTERAKRFGAKGLVHLAPSRPAAAAAARSPSSCPTTSQRAHRRGGPGPGRATSSWSSPTRRRSRPTCSAGCASELGERLGLADPNVLAYVWVNRFPMYQWDAENGRWDATHNPFSGVVPEDEALLVTASGDPATAVARTIRPAGPGRSSTTSRSTAGSSAAARCASIAATCSSAASCSRARRIEGMREKFGAILDAFEYGAPPHGGIALGIDRWAALLATPDQHPRGHGLPQDPVGQRPDARGAVAARSRSSTRSSGCASSACRRSRGRRRDRAAPGRAGRLTTTAAPTPARHRAARRDRPPTAPGRPDRRAVHRVLGHLLPVGRGVALDRDGLPGAVRAAAAGPRRGRRAAALRPAADPRGRARGPRRRSSSPGDLLFWHHAIEYVGAGLATVLGNLQVLIVGVVAWLVFGERPSRDTLLALPVVLVGRRAHLGRHRGRGVRQRPGARRAPRPRSPRCATAATCCSSGAAAATPGGRPDRSPSPRSSTAVVAAGVGTVGRRPRPDARPGEPVLAGGAGRHLAVDRLPVHLDLAAAPAGRHHLDHPARPAGHDRRPGDGPARRAAVAGAAPGRRPGHRRDRASRRCRWPGSATPGARGATWRRPPGRLAGMDEPATDVATQPAGRPTTRSGRTGRGRRSCSRSSS